jgi:hypothetical protein
MRTTTFLSIFLTGALLACSSPSGPPADRIVYETSEAAATPLDAMAASQKEQQPRQPAGVKVADMTEGERIAWFERHGTYPGQRHSHSGNHDQTLGYVDDTTAWDYIWPGLLIAGAAWGLYEIKRHND